MRHNPFLPSLATVGDSKTILQKSKIIFKNYKIAGPTIFLQTPIICHAEGLAGCLTNIQTMIYTPSYTTVQKMITPKPQLQLSIVISISYSCKVFDFPLFL